MNNIELQVYRKMRYRNTVIDLLTGFIAGIVVSLIVFSTWYYIMS